MKKKIINISMIGILFAMSQSIFASSNLTITQIDRYLSVANEPLIPQVDLLQQTFQTHFPQNVHTINDAILYLLQFSGYSLVDKKFFPSDVKTMLAQSLPVVDRTFGPMTLEQGLETLAGQQFQLLVDPVNRLVSFQLKKTYQKIYQHPLDTKNREGRIYE